MVRSCRVFSSVGVLFDVFCVGFVFRALCGRRLDLGYSIVGVSIMGTPVEDIGLGRVVVG